MLEKYINSKFLNSEKLEEIKVKYINAKPFPHIELDNFFNNEIIDKIKDNFPDLEKFHSYSRSTINEKKFGLEDQNKFPTVINDFILFLNSQSFLKILQKISSINEILIPDPYLVGGGLHQTKKGGFLKIHSDFYQHQNLKIDRRLNLLLYLSDNWKKEYGGHLELWNKYMQKCEKKIFFKFNKLCIFSTDNFSFHGYPDPIICPNDISRKSIALYYYSNGRPDKDKIKEMPNITNWKNRENKKEVYNKYKLKDHLRKISFFRKINNFLK